MGDAEIDLSYWNNQHPSGLTGFEAIGLLECKNTEEPIGSQEIDQFISKIRNRGLTHGIMVTLSGITGNPIQGNAGQNTISRALFEGIRIVVLERGDLRDLSHTDELINLLRQKVCELVVNEAVV